MLVTAANTHRLIDITSHATRMRFVCIRLSAAALALRTALIERDKRVRAARSKRVPPRLREKNPDQLTHHLITRVAMRARLSLLIDGCWGERGVENNADYR